MHMLRIAVWFSAACAAMAQVPQAPTAPSGSYLGVMLQEINSQRAQELRLPKEAGVEITRVESRSPADKAGLKTGDVVVEYNGQHVEGIEQFSRLVRETPPGRQVQLDIYRNGAPQTLMLTAGSRSAAQRFAPQVQPFGLQLPDIPRNVMSWRTAALGVEAESLGGQLAQYFGVSEGVLVRSVTKGSAADKAGIKAGDVITRVGDSTVAAPADVSSRIRALRGKPIPFTVMRDRKEVTLTVTLDDNGRAGRQQILNELENLQRSMSGPSEFL